MSFNTAHAFDDELARLDAIGTAEAIRAGQITAAEAVAAAIKRVERVNPSIAAIATPDFDRALANAQHPHDGAFAGTPTFIKDMIDVAGLPTRWGCDGLRNAPRARKDCGMTRQIKDMGLTPMGTSTMPEFGLTHSSESAYAPPTRNPWNLDHGTGGSSSGAGALVAAGVVPIAHGCDGGGSVRIPASCCGLVGLKSSMGRLLPHPEEALSPIKLVVDGVLTRSVRDTALFFAEAEKRYKNPKLPPMGHVTTPPQKRLRIGITCESPVGAPIGAATRQAFEDTAKLLEDLGHQVEPVSPPVTEDLVNDFMRFFGFLAFALIYGGRIQLSRTFDKSRVTDFSRGFAGIFKKELGKFPGGILRMKRSAATYRDSFTNIDIILSPVSAQVAPPIGHLACDVPFATLKPRVMNWMGISPIANVAGTPSISLPLGHDPATNLPIGMMFDATTGQEAMLLQLALELEEARPWRKLG